MFKVKNKDTVNFEQVNPGWEQVHDWKNVRFWCCKSKKNDLKIHEKELQRYRGIWVTIPWYEMRVLT